MDDPRARRVHDQRVPVRRRQRVVGDGDGEIDHRRGHPRPRRAERSGQPGHPHGADRNAPEHHDLLQQPHAPEQDHAGQPEDPRGRCRRVGRAHPGGLPSRDEAVHERRPRRHGQQLADHGEARSEQLTAPEHDDSAAANHTIHRVDVAGPWAVPAVHLGRRRQRQLGHRCVLGVAGFGEGRRELAVRTTEVGRLQAMGDGSSDVGVEPRAAVELQPPHRGVVESSMGAHRRPRPSAGSDGVAKFHRHAWATAAARSRWRATTATTNSAKAKQRDLREHPRQMERARTPSSAACNSWRRCNDCKSPGLASVHRGRDLVCGANPCHAPRHRGWLWTAPRRRRLPRNTDVRRNTACRRNTVSGALFF